MADETFVHIEDSGTANTPTAGNALRVDYVVDGTKHDNGAFDINVTVTGTNSAVMDNAWAAVRVVFLRDNNEVWSDVVQTDQQCPARGFSGPTVRSGSRAISIPSGVSFNQVGVYVRNMDNFHDDKTWSTLLALALLFTVV